MDLTAICNFLEKAANIEYPSLSKIMKILKWIFLVLAVIYTVSPIDIIPDAPIVGQIDDAAIDLTAVFNLIEKAVRIKYPSFGKFLKILKWTFFALAVLLILAILFFGFLITLQAHRNF
ncbi:MAG: DUF1232 domain-containing protein [Elusimicrobiota bacterium]|nr:DUF1232 domain-containing protein [Elusimicrobiota bacterium]